MFNKASGRVSRALDGKRHLTVQFHNVLELHVFKTEFDTDAEDDTDAEGDLTQFLVITLETSPF